MEPSGEEVLTELADLEAAWKQELPLSYLDVEVYERPYGRPDLIRLNPWQIRFLPPWERMLLEAVELVIRRDYRGADEVAGEMTRLYPWFRDGRLMAAPLAMHFGRLRQAALHFIHAHTIGEPTGERILRICPSLRFRFRLHPVVEVPTYPNLFGVVVGLGTCLAGLGLYPELGELAREGRGLVGSAPELDFLLGYSLFHEGEYGRAAKVLELEHPPTGELELLMNLYRGVSLYRMGDRGRAIFALKHGVPPAPGENPYLANAIRLIRGEMAMAEGYFWDAVWSLAQADPRYLPTAARRRYEEMRTKLRQMCHEVGWDNLPRFPEEEFLRGETIMADRAKKEDLLRSWLEGSDA